MSEHTADYASARPMWCARHGQLEFGPGSGVPVDEHTPWPQAMNTTGQNGYTHIFCTTCGVLLYCSEADPWRDAPEYGSCPHGGTEYVWTEPPQKSWFHRCELDLRNGSSADA